MEGFSYAFSIVFLAVGINFAVLCSWTWFYRWIGKRRGGEIPTSTTPHESSNAHSVVEMSTEDFAKEFGEPHVSTDEILNRNSTVKNKAVDSVSVAELENPATELPNKPTDGAFKEIATFSRVNIEYVNIIGNAWFGKVIEAKATNMPIGADKLRVITKVLKDDATDEERKLFLNESKLYSLTASHENILRLIGRAVEKMPYILLMEHWPLGDLKAYLVRKSEENSDSISNEMRTNIIKGVINGLVFLEKKNFILEDLAARNCLVKNETGQVVIGEYGLSKAKYPNEYFHCSNSLIPLRWMAPETIICEKHMANVASITMKSVVWSFGILLWEIFENGRLPYSDMEDADVLKQVIKEQTYILEPPRVLTESTNTNGMYDVIVACWNPQQKGRPSFQELAEHFA